MKDLQEASLARLFDTWNKYDLGMISAYRHKVNGLDKDPNTPRNHYWQKGNRAKSSDLGKDIENAGYWYTQTMGGYPETDKDGNLKDVKERSYFVVNKNMESDEVREAFEDFMFNMCKKYGQDSVYMSTKNYPSGLYDENRKPIDFGEGPMNNLNKLNSNPDQPYYSRINGSKFSFQKESTEDKSMFRQLVERVLAENGYDLKEWDNDEYYGNPDDHTANGKETEWTVNLPMNDQIRQAIIQANIVGEEDLKDDAGNWLPTSEFNVIVEYNVNGYPDDEYITVNKIYLEDYNIAKHQTYKGTDITQFLPKEFLEKVANELEESGKIELHSYDYKGQVRDDYYSMIAPGGKL